VLRTLGALLVLWLVYLLAMPLLAWSLGSTVDSIPEGDRPANQPGTAILLVGSDSRQDLTQQQRIELGTGSTDGSRTDTMMILYTPRTGRSVLISLPRDSYVAIPGQGRSKLNAAYALGGPKLLMQTVEQNTGLRMDGYLEVGFTGFVGVVDAVGGVDVCLDNPIQDQDSHLDLQAGCQTLNGVTALGYVRMRKADPQGDFGRMQRQREVIGLLVHKIVSPWTVLNPIRWFRVNWAAKDSLRRGANTGLTALPGLVRGMYSVSIGNGLTLTVPVSNPNATTPAGSSVIWDENAAKDMFGQIASGDTSRLDEFAK